MVTFNSKWLRCGLAGLGLALTVAAAPVPDSDITSLETELAAIGSGKSAVEMRMACKSVIRQGKSLLEAHPDAPNRFRVLGIIFQVQKRLFGLENSDRNRTELFATCQELAQAPNEYAALRLEADLLLSERDLAAKEASLQERAEALKAIIDRYRDTPAEAKSLMMAAMIAPKLEANELEDEIIENLNQRFADDPTVIEFIQKNLRVGRLDVVFSGTFTRVDGAVIRFPNDRLGHLCLMVFWSKQSPGFEQYLKQVQEQQALYPNIFDVFSFNLDELPDAGAATLRSLGLEWTVMRLPGGRQSQTYRTYAQKDPLGILVNAFGHAVLAPAVVRQDAFKIDDARVSHDRYLAQLQSLFIGDFLVTDPVSPFDPALPPELKMIPLQADAPAPPGLQRTAASVPEATLRAIQSCFTPPPFRYRLTSAAALANYTKAEQLCRDALQQHPQAPDLWVVRNRRIIALLGKWNLTGDPQHLEQAVAESRAALTPGLPAAAGVVPRFCLAKQALRQDDAQPEPVLSALVQESGAPASAFAAASMLALDAQSKELHERYRSRFMAAPYDGNPALWSFISFLRDRYHRYHLLQGISYDKRSVRGYIINHSGTPPTDRLPAIELKTLDGQTLSLPKDTNGQLTLLVFVEPPDVIKKEVELDSKKRPIKSPSVAGLESALGLANSHINKELKVIPAFLCDDPNKIRAMMEAEGLKCEAAMVPGGLANPLVQRLGILSADRIANIFLLRRDGTIEWQTSGLGYKTDHGGGFAMNMAMKVHTEICEVETGYETLRQRDFKRAVSLFSGPFPPDRRDHFQWDGPRFHGRALAHMGLKEWDAALADIDAAIAAHNNGDAKTGPCEILKEMRLVRALILEQLGRKLEAEAERKLAAAPTAPHRPSPYEVFQNKLTALRRDRWK